MARWEPHEDLRPSNSVFLQGLVTVDEQVRALVEVFKGHRYGHGPDVPDAPGSYPSVLVNTGTLQMDCASSRRGR